MRHIRSALIFIAPLLLLAAPAMAVPSISYPTFLFNAPFQSNGNASGVMFSTLLVTNGANETGSIFVNTPQDLTQSFEAQYGFEVGPGVGIGGSGPVGLAFVIENDPRGATALGGPGQQIAYGDGQLNSNQAIQNSLALVYSTYTDQFQLFTNTNNANLNVISSPLATQVGSENLFGILDQMTVDYAAPDITFPTGAVTVLLNGNSIGLDNVSLPASLTTLAGGSTGYFGFTSTTGAGSGGGNVQSLIVGAPVPEPATAGLLVAGTFAFLARRRRI